MGVDVSAVAGWGVVIPREEVDAIMVRLETDDLEWEGTNILKDFFCTMTCERFGSCYCEDSIDYAILSPYHNHVSDKIDDINEVFGTSFNKSDIKFIKETLYW